MSEEIKLLLAVISSFVLAMALSPLIIRLMKALKAGQPILEYVDKHEGKSGTPTMGGIIFLLPMAIVTLIFSINGEKMGIVAMAITLSYGLIGLLDDFIKVKFKHNKGLKAYQKIIGQFGIGIIAALYCYKNNFIGSSIQIPFTDKTIDLQWWFVPLCLFVYLAMTNAVNLTDGLDGLVGKSSSVNLIFFALIVYAAYVSASKLGDTFYALQLLSLEYFVCALLGAMLAFLWYNNHPAKIFMGDTGSLAIGGALTCIAIFISQPLILLLIGIMYIVSCISVILQVISFKVRKKRIFLIAPYHHHLEYKGIHENRVVGFYAIITFIASAIALISVLV
ncbi:MAG: phospho-N-acetylmuramoyl-pentapeptide-transferase [Clostridia bacterium]|nr:phospho-N-acetylmuramoyl-pentapeptide-transferase [Clostridia bacterium]MDE7328332.1 phospho-N-acetylmuramoyl-pentapeptide-transferase [Clostridia bacterium]